jgi:hypothetical protein
LIYNAHARETELAKQMSREQLMRLARVGAVARLSELRLEIASLEAIVGQTRRPVRATRREKKRESRQAAPAPRRASPSWSAAARKAVSLRMKKYWAARRQAKKP